MAVVGAKKRLGIKEYEKLHSWLKWNFDRGESCEHCGVGRDNTQLEWANVSGEYRKDRNDFIVLCRPCHSKYDYKNRPQLLDECYRGHPYSGENLYISPKGTRLCRECRRINGRKYDAKPERREAHSKYHKERYHSDEEFRERIKRTSAKNYKLRKEQHGNS